MTLFIVYQFSSQKRNSERSAINFIDKRDGVNPFISQSDEEDAKEERNVIKDETNEDIIM